MTYKVLDAFLVGDNTSVTIAGNGSGLKNGIIITTPKGENYTLLTVGMVSGGAAEDITKTTTILVEGKFTAKTFIA